MADVRVPSETARFMHALFDLLSAVKAADPDLAAALTAGAVRVNFDAEERLILISVVDDRGRGHAVRAVQADAFDRAEFGAVGVPMPIAGMYDLQAH